MNIATSRFGTIEVDGAEVIRFPSGIVGFPDDRDFVLLRRREGSPIAWLQSATAPWLALPVVAAAAIAQDWPDETIDESARAAGLSAGAQDLAVMVVLSAPGGGAPATVNLLAPIVVDVATRTGVQLLLERTRFGAQEPLALRPDVVEAPRAHAEHAAPAGP